MTIRNTEKSYGSVAVWLHWSIGLLVVGLWLLGDYMHGLPDATAAERGYKYGLYGWHKAFGVIALLFILFRMSWRLSNPRPQPPAGMAAWEKTLAGAVHLLLYLLMLALPLSGWLMSTTFSGKPVDVFGVFQMPVLLGKDPELNEFFGEAHEIAATLLLWAFLLHVVAALYHRFVKKDTVLGRMSLRGRRDAA